MDVRGNARSQCQHSAFASYTVIGNSVADVNPLVSFWACIVHGRVSSSLSQPRAMMEHGTMAMLCFHRLRPSFLFEAITPPLGAQWLPFLYPFSFNGFWPCYLPHTISVSFSLFVRVSTRSSFFFASMCIISFSPLVRCHALALVRLKRCVVAYARSCTCIGCLNWRGGRLCMACCARVVCTMPHVRRGDGNGPLTLKVEWH